MDINMNMEDIDLQKFIEEEENSLIETINNIVDKKLKDFEYTNNQIVKIQSFINSPYTNKNLKKKLNKRKKKFHNNRREKLEKEILKHKIKLEINND